MNPLITAVFVVALGMTSFALACEPSPDAGRRVATNIELVQRADVIVLARVIDGPPRGAPVGFPGQGQPEIVLQPIELLKGATIADQQLRLFGSLFDRNGRPVLPSPTLLTEAHPNAYEGGCIRLQFAKGVLVVAMFKRTQTGLRELTFPLTRNVEDVPDAMSIWVRAVRFYVQATSAPGAAQRRKLALLQRRLQHSQRADDREIANDIWRYLKINVGSTKQRDQLWGEFAR